MAEFAQPDPKRASIITHMTAVIVSAAAGNESSRTRADELPSLIRAVRAALADDGVQAAGKTVTPEPAAPMSRARWSKLITPERITSLLDGKAYTTLKRHLTARGHTPDSYRKTFGLPADFPMVSATSSKARGDAIRRSNAPVSKTVVEPAPLKARRTKKTG